jgi:hypothetical protein
LFSAIFRANTMTQQEIEELVEVYGSEEAVPLATGALMPPVEEEKK